MIYRNRWRKISRQRILIEQNNRCIYCHCPLSEGTLEHIRPQKDGGTDDNDNLSVACLECNRAKGCMSVGKFKKCIKSNISSHWSRRKIHIAGMRAERNILRFVGLEQHP